MTRNNNISLRELIHAVAEERGLDLRGYKQPTLDRRVRKRMFQIGASSFSEYLEKVRQDPAEANALLNTVLINVTEFFRDPQAWECLREDMLPQLLGHLKPGDSFRAWSAGCASGEEPFSLAISLADFFGPQLSDYDIKIYATDVDEDALNVARRGEYAAAHLRRVHSAWRERYFTGDSHLRVNREIRRMVIFGRSNLVSDAPISHCNLVICRNVLIYFDAATQQQALSRLEYALDPGGVLFLGKAESKLNGSKAFTLLNSRWRIFQRGGEDFKQTSAKISKVANVMNNDDARETNRQEVEKLRNHYRFLLETLNAGVMILDSKDVISSHNSRALAVWGLDGVPIVGQRLQNTELLRRCPDIDVWLEASRAKGPETVTFECREKSGGRERVVSVNIRPILSEVGGERTGSILYTEDITSHGKLQNTVEELEATSEELQSANEELETINEEMQSTNEELETTNEELQSTNEELERKNEELQALNEELEARTREKNEITSRYAETLKQMPWPVMLVDREEKIQLWNLPAQGIFGVGATSVAGVALDQLPMEIQLRKALVRRCRAVLASGKPSTIRNQRLNHAVAMYDIHCAPISHDDTPVDGVMVMFGPSQPAKAKGVASAKKTKTKRSAVEPSTNGRSGTKAGKAVGATKGR